MNRDASCKLSERSTYSKTMVDLRINETRQTGAVFNRTYRIGLNAVRLESRYIGRQARTGPDNKFTSLPRASGIYRGDRNRGAKVSIYFWNSP